MRQLRVIGAIAGWTLVVACCALLAGFTFVGAAGYHPLTVVSGSMTPAIRTGDLVVDETVSPLRTKAGDVITFQDPQDQGRLITHRVVRRRLDGTTVRFVTRGDANTGVERWTIPAAGTLGVVRLRIPKAGYVLAWTRTAPGRATLLIFPALFLCGSLLLRIWRREHEPAAA